MQKFLYVLFLLIALAGFSQQESTEEDIFVDEIEETVQKYDYDYSDSYYNEPSYLDTKTYDKNNNFETQRNFDEEPSKKYTGSEFEYVDDLKKKEPKQEKKEEIQKNSPVKDASSTALNGLVGFLGTIFPYLLGIIVVLIILKVFVKTDSNFWNFNKSSEKTKPKKLVYEDVENIDKNDYYYLLNQAVQNGDYRLATRYYYLALLKKLSQKELIKYDKDKTNTEYQFELKNQQLRSGFQYLAYIYDYVWYGEFPIDKVKFVAIENKYKTFIQKI